MPLELERAEAASKACREHAASIGIAISVAVVDEGGMLQSLARMDGAPPLSAQIAEAKAVGAALWHRDGDQLASVHQERPAFFAAVDRMVRMPMIPGLGSLVIREDGRVVGAIGVSGGKPEQDQECAHGGLEASARA